MKKRHLRKSIETVLWIVLFLIIMVMGSLVDIQPSGFWIVFGAILTMFCIVWLLTEYGTMQDDD